MNLFRAKKQTTELSDTSLQGDKLAANSTDTDSFDYDKLQQKIKPKKGAFIIKLIVGRNPKPIVQETRRYPLLTSNILSVITFTWVEPIIRKGYLRRIEDEDLYPLDGPLSVSVYTKTFEENLEKRIDEWKLKHPEDSKYDKWVLIKALNDTFKYRFWLQGGIAKIVSDLIQMFMPLLVRSVVRYIQHKNQPGNKSLGDAIGYAIGISVMLITNTLCVGNFFHGSMLTGGQVKASLTNVIYKKSFTMSARAKFQFPNGKINSIVMADLARIDFAAGTFHFLWSFPIGFSVGIIIVCIMIGPAALLGVLCVLLTLGFVFFVTLKLKNWRRTSLPFIDKRVHAINEIVNNLKMIKFYCWESAYYSTVEQYRTNEKQFILKMQLSKSYMNALIGSVTYLATLFSFLTIYYTSSSFQPYNVFSSITLFNALRFPLNLLPVASSSCMDALIALDRVAEFLQVEDGEDLVEKFELEESENAIEISNASFQWETEGSDEQYNHQTKSKEQDTDEKDLSFPGLVDINLNIKRGEFVIVTGSIGTGKTSLLNAIEGSMEKQKGDLRTYGSLTFCSYPWVQNATVKENILFGSPYDKNKYDAIINACALDVDFKILPDGDSTEVGERGITLSGGQKARINLARAVYAGKDIILLDDVLSAVDARVGKHIMNECITGLLKDKTRVLATHQLSLAGAADRIIVLDGSGNIEVGTKDELTATSKAFANLMTYSKESNEEKKEKEGEQEETEKEELIRQKSVISRIQSTKEEEEKEKKDQNSNSSEARGTKSISLEIYASYLSLGTGLPKMVIVPIFLIALIINGFLQCFHAVWLSFWLSNKFGYSSHVYAGLYVLFIFLATGSYFLLYFLLASINNKAGLELFNLSSSKLLKTPMWFMDITPIGRILNRFTKDVDTLDTDLVEQARLFLTSLSLVGAVLILCGIYIPWFFIAIPIAFYILGLILSYYQSSSLDIKRLEANRRSYVFSHFNESLSGMKVIKSYGSQTRFLKKYEELIDDMNAASFITLANQRWLSLRLDIVSASITLFVSLLCVCGVFHLSGSSSGLLVSYIVQVASIVSLTLRSMTQLENDFNSVERLFEYARDLPQEAPYHIEAKKPVESWPSAGAINFDNVSLSYREGLPLVLKNVSFDVKAGEKIGICGRTGAGKSTIMNALFRVSELATGAVTIDDVNISEIGLTDLRSKLSIIPQDPVLFHGTVRRNLDPFDNSSDQELWSALRRSGLVHEGDTGVNEFNSESDNLKSFHKFHLDQLVEDDGANFSLGERQLLALARALVRNSKVLILDEATSSVDYETDAMIQSTISNEFAHCTILCIAHRLKTILNYDKILVLDQGEVKEFDTPYNLFKNGGIFSLMCLRSNITEQDFAELSK